MAIRIIGLKKAKSGSKRTPGQIRSGHGATAATEMTHDAAFADEVDSSYTVWLPRDKAADYLRSVGYRITPQRLAKLAVTGGGPESCCWEGHEFYEVTQLIEWAQRRASTPGRTAPHPMT